MIREVDLKDISDGRLYSENDMVRADTGNCAGCKEVCCKGMGQSIILDPYDIHRICQVTGKDFNKLLEEGKIEINVVDGLMLPNLKMSESTGACSFLDEENRCLIHTARPSVCRLFPLGRYWEDETHFKYILQKNQCHKDNLSKIKVKKWIDTLNWADYNKYVVEWHVFIRRVGAAAAEISANAGEVAKTQIRTICMYTLKTFYMTPFGDEFYEEVEARIKKAFVDLGMEEA